MDTLETTDDPWQMTDDPWLFETDCKALPFMQRNVLSWHEIELN